MLHTKKNAYRDSNHKCMFWKGKSNLLTVEGIETWHHNHKYKECIIKNGNKSKEGERKRKTPYVMVEEE